MGVAIELTPTAGLSPSAADAILREMQETTYEVQLLRQQNVHLAGMVRESHRRAVRTETRLVKLMDYFGLDPMGDVIEPEPALPEGTV